MLSNLPILIPFIKLINNPENIRNYEQNYKGKINRDVISYRAIYGYKLLHVFRDKIDIYIA